MRRWVLTLLTACTPIGPDSTQDPEPQPEPPTPSNTSLPARCAHDPPAWLTAPVDKRIEAMPPAPKGPGVAAKDRRRPKNTVAWRELVSNEHLDVPRGPLACRRQHVVDHDDRRPVATVMAQYDKSGRTVFEKEDRYTDGGIDERRKWSYDAADALVSFERTVPRRFACVSFVPARREERRYVYDRFGLHLRTDIDSDGDGDVDRRVDWRAIRYDEDGLPALVVHFDSVGAARIITRLTWTDDGHLSERLVLDGSRAVLEAERYEYDEHGQTSWTSAIKGGGSWRTSKYTHDDQGQPVAIATDIDGDCLADEQTLISYAAHGKIASSTTRVAAVITTADGYEYDEATRLLRFSRQSGDVPDAEFKELRYDAAGRETHRRVRERRPIDKEGTTYVFDDEIATRYDDEGRVAERRAKNGEFGPDEKVDYEYACGRRYRRYPKIDPYEDPELAEHCYINYE